MSDALELAVRPDATVRVAWRRCDRRGQCRRASLVALCGDMVRLPDVLAQLAHDCPRRGAIGNEACGGHFPDLLERPPEATRGRALQGGDVSADEPTIESLPDAIGSVVNRLVENEGASFPFLVAAVGLDGSIWYGRVELIDAENGKCSTVAETLVEGGFTFPINIMVIDGRGKGYLARIGTEDLRPVH